MVLATKKNCQRVLAAGLRVVSAMTGNSPSARDPPPPHPTPLNQEELRLRFPILVIKYVQEVDNKVEAIVLIIKLNLKVVER